MNDLFGATTRHDPGGKVKTALPAGMLADAMFHGPRDEHRIWLLRRWDNPVHRQGPVGSMILIPFVLSIGMNPSTADRAYNDPTISRDIGFAESWGFKMLFKCNVGSWRCTKPQDLKAPGVSPCIPLNIRTIRELAGNPHCGRIVLCTGNLPKVLREPAAEVISLLQQDGRKLWHFGRNPSGDTMHPLYLLKDAPLVEYTT